MYIIIISQAKQSTWQ